MRNLYSRGLGEIRRIELMGYLNWKGIELLSYLKCKGINSVRGCGDFSEVRL